MKVIITSEVRESFEDNSYKNMEKLKLHIKDLKNQIKILEEQLILYKDMYYNILEQIKGSLIMDKESSDMHSAIENVTRIKTRMHELRKKLDETMRKDGTPDPKYKKQYDLLMPVLQEDLEIAEMQMENMANETHLLDESYSKVKKDYNNCKKSLRDKKIELTVSKKEYKRILKNIKIVNNAFEKNKKISERILKTPKSKTKKYEIV